MSACSCICQRLGQLTTQSQEKYHRIKSSHDCEISHQGKSRFADNLGAMARLRHDDEWHLIRGEGRRCNGFYTRFQEDLHVTSYRFTFEMAAPNVGSKNSHQYVLFILFNPPEAQVGRTVERLKDITIGEGSVFDWEHCRIRGGVDGFKIVNLYAEIQGPIEKENFLLEFSPEKRPEIPVLFCDTSKIPILELFLSESQAKTQTVFSSQDSS